MTGDLAVVEAAIGEVFGVMGPVLGAGLGLLATWLIVLRLFDTASSFSMSGGATARGRRVADQAEAAERLDWEVYDPDAESVGGGLR